MLLGASEGMPACVDLPLLFVEGIQAMNMLPHVR